MLTLFSFQNIKVQKKKKKGVNGPKAQRRKIRDQSETKLLEDQAIERKGQNIWPTNTGIS